MIPSRIPPRKAPGTHQGTGNCGQRRTNGESQRNRGIDVNAHQLGSTAVLGHSQHSVTGGSVVDEQGEHNHDEDAGQDGDQRFG